MGDYDLDFSDLLGFKKNYIDKYSDLSDLINYHSPLIGGDYDSPYLTRGLDDSLTDNSSPLAQPASTPSGNSNALSFDLANRLKSAQDQYTKNALEAQATPELSGTQVGVSAAVKLLPLLLGMAIAKNRNLGAASGATGGLAASAQYEKDIEDEQKAKAAKAQILAIQNAKDITALQNEQYQLQKQDINREDQQAFQQNMFNQAEAGRNARAGQSRTAEDVPLPPLVQSGLIKRQNGIKPTPEEEQAMNATFKTANLAARVGENADVNQRSKTRQDYLNKIYDTKQNEKAIFGTEDVLDSSGKPMTQSIGTADKARIAMESNRVIQGSLDRLIQSYKDSGGRDFLGGDRQLQDAEGSLIWSYMRNVLKTGMRLEGKEQNLVNSLAPATYSLDGFFGVLRNEFEKGDPEDIANTLKDVVNRATQERLLSANKKLSGTTIPEEGVKSAPPGMSFEEFKAWKAQNG